VPDAKDTNFRSLLLRDPPAGLQEGHGQTLSETTNGAFKVVVRTQEISHSGTRNVDVCVANASSSGFPEKKVQCFLSGYDFDGLSVKWQGPRVIEISFSSGRVSRFTNSAFVYPGRLGDGRTYPRRNLPWVEFVERHPLGTE